MNPPLSLLALVGDIPGPTWMNHDLIATLLILFFGMVLGMMLVCLLMIMYSVRRGRTHSSPRGRKPELAAGSWKWQTPIQGTPARWLALRTTNMHWVQMALRLHNPSPCSWEEGLHAAHEQKLFISPPVAGWILVFGANLPDPADDVDRCYHFVVQLSRKLGQVQMFSLNRVLNHHAWILADQGRIQRAYAWAGRTLWNQGKVTRAETDLRLKFYEYADSPDRMHFAHGSPAALNTERVPMLAARWSVDPTALNSRLLRESHGIAGELSRPKLH